jgi:formylglycine-generating enzyme required for sulfatase activity
MGKIVLILLMGLVFNALPANAETNVEMVRIPAGSFVMGAKPITRDAARLEEISPQGLVVLKQMLRRLDAANGSKPNEVINEQEMPQHKVKIKAFEIGKYEVTQAQWQAIMGAESPLFYQPNDNPSYFKNCGDTCPVENVSWNDIQKFIEKLNAKTGKTYRLPSEAEWEYACRAGKSTKYCGGNNADTVAWHDGNSDRKTHPVGKKQPNGFGLYDMSGNVREWVQDGYHDNYNGAPSNGAAWGGGQFKVLRGGSSGFEKRSDLRAAARGHSDPSDQGEYIGFRLARTLP